MTHAQPIHLLHEPRPDTAAEEERGRLEGELTLLRGSISRISGSYRWIDTPDHIEEAIRKLEDAADDIRRRMAALDEGTA